MGYTLASCLPCCDPLAESSPRFGLPGVPLLLLASPAHARDVHIIRKHVCACAWVVYYIVEGTLCVAWPPPAPCLQQPEGLHVARRGLAGLPRDTNLSAGEQYMVPIYSLQDVVGQAGRRRPAGPRCGGVGRLVRALRALPRTAQVASLTTEQGGWTQWTPRGVVWWQAPVMRANV